MADCMTQKKHLKLLYNMIQYYSTVQYVFYYLLFMQAETNTPPHRRIQL